MQNEVIVAYMNSITYHFPGGAPTTCLAEIWSRYSRIRSSNTLHCTETFALCFFRSSSWKI